MPCPNEKAAPTRGLLPYSVRVPANRSNLNPVLMVNHGVARNVSLELRKARTRSCRWVTAMDALPERPSPVGGPEEQYLGHEAAHIVTTALTQLPEERRAMLLLRLDH